MPEKARRGAGNASCWMVRMAVKTKDGPGGRPSQFPRMPSVPPKGEGRTLSPQGQRTLDKRLFRAVRCGQWERAEALAEGGAKPGVCDRLGYNAFTYAAAEGKAKLVRLMIEGGYKPNIRNIAARVGFMRAKINGHEETASIILAQEGFMDEGKSAGFGCRPWIEEWP